MAGLFDSGTSRRVEIGSGVITTTGSWSVYCVFIYPTAGSKDTRGPLLATIVWTESFPGFTLFMYQPLQQLWIIIRNAAGSDVFNNTSGITIPFDTWLGCVLVYDDAAGEVRLSVNGSTFTTSVTAFGAVTWNRVFAVGYGHSSADRYTGRIAHAAMWNKALSVADAEMLAFNMLSPEFLPDSGEFHVPIWNADNLFDLLGNQSVSTISMTYAKGGPVVYPAPNRNIKGPVAPPSTLSYFNVWSTFG